MTLKESEAIYLLGVKVYFVLGLFRHVVSMNYSVNRDEELKRLRFWALSNTRWLHQRLHVGCCVKLNWTQKCLVEENENQPKWPQCAEMSPEGLRLFLCQWKHNNNSKNTQANSVAEHLVYKGRRETHKQTFNDQFPASLPLLSH